MRAKRTVAGLTVNAIAGTHVVLLGLDHDDQRRKGCLGFAIQREDHTEDERYWLSGMKTFEATDPGLGAGGQVSTRQHPLQAFQWSDYSAKPDHDYTYTVIPLYGTPAALVEGKAVVVRISTEKEDDRPHSVYFNRGAIASQEYTRRFQNRAPSEVGEPAYRWLSRGLFEALIRFIERAKGKDYALHGAFYEFQWPPVLTALAKMSKGKAMVRLIYDGMGSKTGPKVRNLAAIAAANIGALCTPRSIGTLMHNKFLILSRKGKPVAVWTGSTNLSENGLFGHSNCGHVVEDSAVASDFLAYWHQMHADPTLADERIWMAANNAMPPATWATGTTTVFSPRKGLAVLQAYADLAASATGALFMTFAFGMHEFFKTVYRQDDGILRFALMEKEGNGAGLAQGRIDVKKIRALPNVVVAVAKSITMNRFDRWLKERAALSHTTHVRYIHDKFMLVDPLGKNPVVITGSANFSKPSTDTNQENMLVIRNDRRSADIYLGEFMRCYSHYAFREVVSFANHPVDWKPNFLSADDSWQRDYFIPGHQRFLRRKYFAQT